MKRILIALLTLSLVFGCLFAFASCEEKDDNKEKEEKVENIGEKPSLNIEDSSEALEDEGYEVSYSDDPDDLGVGAEEGLSAYKTAEDGNDSEYLYIVKYSSEETAKIYYKQLKTKFDYRIESVKVEIEYCEHVLEKYEDELDSDEIDDIEDELKDLEKELEKYENEFSLGISDNCVWYGTAEAVKITKGSNEAE